MDNEIIHNTYSQRQMTEKTPLVAKTKIWIEDDNGDVIFGIGRVRMLEAIRQAGSLHAAAKELKMGYKGLWARIKATEERLGRKLLTRQKGGSRGGGSQLTPLAEALVENFRILQEKIIQETDMEFDKILNSDLFVEDKNDDNI